MSAADPGKYKVFSNQRRVSAFKEGLIQKLRHAWRDTFWGKVFKIDVGRA